MTAIPPNTYLEGFKKSMCDGIDGAFKKGVKYGRYLEQQERPALDAVPREEYDALLKRFRHLLESDYIRSFDEYDPQTGTYKRDITEADAVVSPVRCKDCVHYDNTPYDWVGPRYCECLGCYRQGDFFCAYGRKHEVIRDE